MSKMWIHPLVAILSGKIMIYTTDSMVFPWFSPHFQMFLPQMIWRSPPFFHPFSPSCMGSDIAWMASSTSCSQTSRPRAGSPAASHTAHVSLCYQLCFRCYILLQFEYIYIELYIYKYWCVPTMVMGLLQKRWSHYLCKPGTASKAHSPGWEICFQRKGITWFDP